MDLKPYAFNFHLSIGQLIVTSEKNSDKAIKNFVLSLNGEKKF